MRLKGLEIQGFKSFPERTVFKFQSDGLTGVVGPNGCGKSNIVDAVRWTLGEQSAKLLRGQMMEDVIFNGSDRRKPGQMAEVTLTFENDGTMENQWRDYSEVSVSRKLFRTGESEYLINGVVCRLKDVRELIADAGGSSRGYSIVEQGRISLLINSKPEEKRALIEEAAGVLKYRMRRIEAERKLERTRQNLLRVGDILREVQRQLNAMKRTAAKARRYRIMREELNEIVLRLRFEEYAANGELLADLESKREKLGDEVTSLEGDLSRLEAREVDLRNELAAGEERITGEFERIRSIEGEIARLEGDISVREGAVRSLEERLVRLTEDEGDLEQRSESDLGELKQLEMDLTEIEKDHESHVARQMVLEEEYTSLEEDLIRGREDREKARSDLFSMGTERSRLEMMIESGNRSRETTLKRREEACLRREAIREKIQAARELVRDRELEHARALEDSEKVNAELERQRGLIQEHRGSLTRSESRLASLSERQAELRGLQKTLIALEEKMEGLPDGVRSVMVGFGQTGRTGVLGVVADYMEVPREYERAVMAVLGERLEHVIVEDPESGRLAVDYLKEKTSGRGSFIPRVPRANGRSSLEGVSGSGIIGPLSTLVSFSRELNGLGDFLLGGALLVQNLEVALKLWTGNGFTATLVTLDGDVVDPSGIISGGNQNVEETPLVRKRKLRELGSECLKAEADLNEERGKRDHLREFLAAGEGELGALEEKGRETEKVLISSESGMTLSTGELRNLDGVLEDLDAQIALAEMEEGDLERASREHIARLEELKKEEDRCGGGIVELEKAGKDLALKVEELRKALEGSRLKVNTAQLRRANSQRALEAARDRNKEFENHRMRIAVEMGDAQSRITKHKQEIENGRETVRVSVVQLEERKESLSTLRRGQEETRKAGESLAQGIRELRSRLDRGREDCSAVDIRIHELRAETQHIQNRVAEEHDLDIGELTPDRFGPDEFDREGARDRIEHLREKISRLGDVNPGAVDEFEELNERFVFLSTQKNDLEESIASLQQAIRKINRTSRERFLSTFREVSEKFSGLFPRLIDGGSAEMILLDEGDPLNTGVDIQVQLPGKRLKNMQLLSGGEKAMVSLTMILSMFLVKPSPVCILDEVDAPLDDENIGNFAQIVREMSQHFQFLIITHNKLTMEAVDVLYGITMREPGVSQVVSVRLRDVA